MIFSVIICECNAETNVQHINKSLMIEKKQDDVFYYKSCGAKRILCATNLSTDKTKIIYEQDFIEPAAFSLIEDKIYFVGNGTLYSKVLNDLTGEITTEGVLPEGSTELYSLNRYFQLKIFEYNGGIYVQGDSLYRLKNGCLVKIFDDVASVCLDNNNLYYGDTKGNIYKTDERMTEVEKVISSEKINNIDNKYVTNLGGMYSINELQIYRNKLYFILAPSYTMNGQIFLYDLTSKTIQMAESIPNTSIFSFMWYRGRLYCFGMTGIYKNAIFTISNNNINILSPYASGFDIIENKVYYYDYDEEGIRTISILGGIRNLCQYVFPV